MKLEEYILKRKTEDGIDEFDRDKRIENTRICVNYVFDYFNNYLETTPGEEKTILHDEKIEKYKNSIRKYSDDICEWLTNMYSSYGKYLNRTLPTFIKDPYFLLYDSEAEFRSLSYNLYPKIIKKYPFLDRHSEMIFLFLKDEHRVRNLITEDQPVPHITEEIDEWIRKTYLKYGVSMYSFCYEYLMDFMDNPDKWPATHKKRSKYYNEYRNSINGSKSKFFGSLLYDYDFQQKNNLFGLDMLYRNMPKKAFIKGKKQEMEAIMMYGYCHDWTKEEKYWDEYSEKLL